MGKLKTMLNVAKNVAIGAKDTAVTALETNQMFGDVIEGAVHVAGMPVKPLASGASKVIGGAIDTIDDALHTETGKKIGQSFVRYNTSNDNNMMPFQVGGMGALATFGVASGGILASEGIKAHGANKLGYVSYMDGPARLTTPDTNGLVNAAHRLSKGNPEAFNEIASQGLKQNSLFGAIDDYGATGDLVFALHNAR